MTSSTGRQEPLQALAWEHKANKKIRNGQLSHEGRGEAPHLDKGEKTVKLMQRLFVVHRLGSFIVLALSNRNGGKAPHFLQYDTSNHPKCIVPTTLGSVDTSGHVENNLIGQDRTGMSC